MSNAVSKVTAALKKTTDNTTSAIKTLADSLSKQNAYRQLSVSKATNNTIKSAQSDNVAPVNATLRERQDKSDEELRREADKYAEDNYNRRVSALDVSTGGKLATVNRKLGDLEAKGESDIREAQGNYQSAQESISEKAIRNGTVNSSIFRALRDTAAEEYAVKMQEIGAELNRKTEELNRQKEIIETSRYLALQDYELKRAAEYESKLAELRQEELEARKAVADYNARLAEFQANYEKNLERTLEEWKKARAEGLV